MQPGKWHPPMTNKIIEGVLLRYLCFLLCFPCAQYRSVLKFLRLTSTTAPTISFIVSWYQRIGHVCNIQLRRRGGAAEPRRAVVQFLIIVNLAPNCVIMAKRWSHGIVDSALKVKVVFVMDYVCWPLRSPFSLAFELVHKWESNCLWQVTYSKQ